MILRTSEDAVPARRQAAASFLPRISILAAVAALFLALAAVPLSAAVSAHSDLAMEAAASLSSAMFLEQKHELDQERFEQYGRFRQQMLARDDPPAAPPAPAAGDAAAAPPAAGAAAPAAGGAAVPPPADGAAGAGGGSDECDVCTYVLENKEALQPYLCRGLRDPQQQMACVKVLMSLMWWMSNEVYWINYGCQRQAANGGWQWTRPCPPHVICSWLKTLESGNEKPYCPASPQYRKPQ